MGHANLLSTGPSPGWDGLALSFYVTPLICCDKETIDCLTYLFPIIKMRA